MTASIKLIFPRYFLIVAIAGLMSGLVFATSSAELRTTIDDARTLVGEMLIELAEAEAGISELDHVEDDTAQLRSILSKETNVDTDTGTIGVSFAWLYERLEAFETSKDLQQKALILTEIEEKLTSMSWSLEEVERSGKRDRTKDEEKQKLAEILAREEYQKPVVQEESMLEKWIKAISEWLSSLFPSRAPTGGIQGVGALTSIIRVVIVAGIVLLVGFGIYKLGPLLFPGLRRKKRDRRKDRVVLGEVIGADQDSATLFDEAEKFARNGDLRGAIRKGYIALLCELNDRKVLGLARHKTNRDYLRDVRTNQPLHMNMSGMTNSFERHWYGTETGNEADWTEFRDNYQEAIRHT
jgi:hypothetical protein